MTVVIPFRPDHKPPIQTNWRSQKMSIVKKLRNRLIKLLAGNSTVIINAVIEGRAFASKKGFLCSGVNFHNGDFEYAAYVGITPDPTEVSDYNLQGEMLRRIP